MLLFVLFLKWIVLTQIITLISFLFGFGDQFPLYALKSGAGTEKRGM